MQKGAKEHMPTSKIHVSDPLDQCQGKSCGLLDTAESTNADYLSNAVYTYGKAMEIPWLTCPTCPTSQRRVRNFNLLVLGQGLHSYS